MASALLYAASFPPLSLAPLAWIGLAPLLVAIVRVSPSRAAFLGFIWGIVAAYGTTSWFIGMLERYFEQTRIVGWLGFLGVAGLLAGTYYAAFAAWLSASVRQRPISPFVVAAAWGLCEFARATFVLADPWALTAYGQVDVRPLLQVADLAGPYAIGMLVMLVNATLGGVVTDRVRVGAGTLTAVGLTLCTVALYASFRMSSADSGRGLPVAIVQGAIERGHRWQPEYQLLGVDRYLELTRAVSAASPVLVIWPEYAVSLYLQEDGPGQSAILAVTPADLVLGGPHYQFVRGGTTYHNSVFQVRAGRIVDRYDKMRLLPLAETPLAGFHPDAPPFTPGADVRVFETSVGRLGVFICWEAMLPEHVRRLVTGGAEVLANLSNDAWFASAAASEHHLAMARVRAVEERRWLLRAASTGVSAIVDPTGAVVARADVGVAGTLTGAVMPSRTRTVYGRLGDWWVLGAVLVVIADSRGRRWYGHRPAFV